MSARQPHFRFQSTGALLEESFYIERPADEELPAALERGEFCYILAPRQIGKSSLRERAARRLQAGGMRTVSIDLTKFGVTHASARDWYFDLLDWLARGLSLPDPAPFWSARNDLSPVSSFSLFLRQELLARVHTPVVVFLDEIDAVRALDFSVDDFFAALRTVYNDRPSDPACRRLSFCLIGVAAPDDLIRKPGLLTPFNIGRAIRLEDFTREEVSGFAAGLGGLGADPEALLDEVFAWTDGHPYMTQRLCEELVSSGVSTIPSGERVRRLVSALFLQQGVTDPNLRFAQERFDREVPQAPILERVSLYRRVLFGERVRVDGNSRVQQEMRLAGLVKEAREIREADSAPFLRVRNRVFAAVFGEAWVRERATGRLLSDSVTRWLAAGRQEGYLLRGEALAEALAWPHDKAQDEARFLQDSQALQRREDRRRYLRSALGVLLLLFLLSGGWLRARQAQQAAEIARVAEHNARQKAEAANRAERKAREDLKSETDAKFAALRRAAELEKQRVELTRREADLKMELAAQTLLRSQKEAEAAKLRAAKEHDDAEAARKAKAEAQERKREAEDKEIREQVARATLLAKRTGGEHAALGVAIQALLRDVERKRSGRPLRTVLREVSLMPDAVSGLGAAMVNFPRGHSFRGHLGPVTAALFGPDLNVFTASQDGLVLRWDMLEKGGRELLRHEGKVLALVMGEGLLASAGSDGAIQVWSLRKERRMVLRGHQGPSLALALMPGGATLLSGGSDGTARLWDTGTGSPAGVLRGHQGAVTAVAAAADGLAATGGRDGVVRLWRRQHLLWTEADHRYALRSLTFSPDGRFLLSASEGHSAQVYEVSSGARVAILAGHQDALSEAMFCGGAPGPLVVTASKDGTARLWDLGRPGRGGALLPTATLAGHAGGVNTARCSSDGAHIVTASDDGTARLWSGDGRFLMVLTGHKGPVNMALFAPSPMADQIVLTASQDGTARLFTIDLTAVLEMACQEFQDRPSDTAIPPPKDVARIVDEACRELRSSSSSSK